MGCRARLLRHAVWSSSLFCPRCSSTFKQDYFRNKICRGFRPLASNDLHCTRYTKNYLLCVNIVSFNGLRGSLFTLVWCCLRGTLSCRFLESTRPFTYTIKRSWGPGSSFAQHCSGVSD